MRDSPRSGLCVGGDWGGERSERGGGTVGRVTEIDKTTIVFVGAHFAPTVDGLHFFCCSRVLVARAVLPWAPKEQTIYFGKKSMAHRRQQRTSFQQSSTLSRLERGASPSMAKASMAASVGGTEDAAASSALAEGR